MFTHDELIKRQLNQLRYKNPWAITLVEQGNATNSEIADIIVIEPNKASTLYEMKASRGDFLSDKKKVFREHPEQGMGNFRYYVCPKGLIDVSEIPEHWGLLWVYPSQIRTIRKATWQECDVEAEQRIVISMWYKADRMVEEQNKQIEAMKYDIGRYRNEINHLMKKHDRFKNLATIVYKCKNGCGKVLTRIMDEPEHQCLLCTINRRRKK